MCVFHAGDSQFLLSVLVTPKLEPTRTTSALIGLSQHIRRYSLLGGVVRGLRRYIENCHCTGECASSMKQWSSALPANMYIIASTTTTFNILAKYQYHISGWGSEAGGFDQRGDPEVDDMSNGARHCYVLGVIPETGRLLCIGVWFLLVVNIQYVTVEHFCLIKLCR
jgi:hypothetical protein